MQILERDSGQRLAVSWSPLAGRDTIRLNVKQLSQSLKEQLGGKMAQDVGYDFWKVAPFMII